MKAIILLLVFSSGLFADTIRYTVNGEEKVKDNVTFNKVDNINFNCSEEKLLIKGSSKTVNIDDQWTKTELLIIGTFILIVLIQIGIQNDPMGVF